MDPNGWPGDLLIRATIVCLCFAGWGLSAAADESADIRGSWAFNADIGGQCSFSGKATIFDTKDTDASDFGCELTARELCFPFREYIVRQTCTIRKESDKIRLRATIAEFIKGAPNEYVPDHFNLTVKSRSKMVGQLTTDYGDSPAEWIRENGSIS